MIKLLNLTIKIDRSGQYKDNIIGLADLELKDQTGAIVSELKTHNSSGAVSHLKFPVSKIKKIKMSSSFLDVPISWAWKNKLGAGIQFTLKNLKYDAEKGLTGVGADTLLLNEKDFETEIFKGRGEEFLRTWKNIELSNEGDNQIFVDFADLWWEIIKAGEDEQINRLVPKVETIITSTEWMEFYELENINDNEKSVKKMCQDFIQEVRELAEWRDVGIKTLLAAQGAKKNGFDLIGILDLKDEIRDGKYYGFPIASGEKYQRFITMTNSFFSHIPSSIFFLQEQARYTKKNIDTFRELFPNDKDQSDPKYFRGFRPGDIIDLGDGFYSAHHQKDLKDEEGKFYKIKNGEEFTRTYYELKSCYESKTTNKEIGQEIIKILFRPEAFNEYVNKTKKEHWDIYWKWLNYFYISQFAEGVFGGIHRKLTDLFSVLEKSYTNESKENCELALNILRGYENPVANSDEEVIKNKFSSSEINAKKTEITNRIKALHLAAIDAAANEDYGTGQLNNERKKIFTVHKTEIKNETILTEIKELIKSLVRAEKSMLEFKNLDKMALAKNIKEEYQQGSGDKKTAYDIVNLVDNQWVDRIITELGTIKRKDPQILLEESRNSIKLKYANEAAMQAIFDNQVLDSVAALQAAEKLLIKVREAQSKNDLDAALLTLLQGYQEAQFGTLKNKAWQAVNSYQQQVEVALNHLQKRDQVREEVAKTLQEAKNESELEAVYNKIKDSELYKQGGKSRKIIRNLRRRKRVSFKINQEEYSAENKNFLQVALVKLIPETVKDDNGEQALTELENQLKTYKTSPESEEKGQIYQKYQKTIDQVLNEIRVEKQRYQQAKQQVEEEPTSGVNQKPSADSRLPDWAWGLIIIVIAVVVGTIFLVSILHFYRWRGRKNSTKKSI